MTNPKWIIGLMTLFVVFSLISGLIEWAYGSEVTKLTTLMKPSLSISYVENLWNMFWFNYPFFSGHYAVVKYAIFWPISIGLIVSFVVMVVSGIVGLLRGLF